MSRERFQNRGRRPASIGRFGMRFGSFPPRTIHSTSFLLLAASCYSVRQRMDVLRIVFASLDVLCVLLCLWQIWVQRHLLSHVRFAFLVVLEFFYTAADIDVVLNCHRKLLSVNCIDSCPLR